MKKLFLSLTLLLIINQPLNCGILSWLNKNDNTITAGIAGTVAGYTTWVAGHIVLDPKIHYESPTCLKKYITNRSGLFDNYYWNNKPYLLISSCLIGISSYTGYKAYKKVKAYLEKNKANQAK
jgi:hypothetical protein